MSKRPGFNFRPVHRQATPQAVIDIRAVERREANIKLMNYNRYVSIVSSFGFEWPGAGELVIALLAAYYDCGSTITLLDL